MNPVDLLKQLDQGGAQLELSLRGSNLTPEHKALVREHRDSLLEHLAGKCLGTANASQSTGLTLYGDLLHNLMGWIAHHHELRLEHPGGVTLNARPEHAVQHLANSAWCVLSDETKTILATAGNVPRHALIGKTELQPIATGQAPVTTEKVVN